MLQVMLTLLTLLLAIVPLALKSKQVSPVGCCWMVTAYGVPVINEVENANAFEPLGTILLAPPFSFKTKPDVTRPVIEPLTVYD